MTAESVHRYVPMAWDGLYIGTARLIQRPRAARVVVDHICPSIDHCCVCHKCRTVGYLGDDRCVRCGNREPALAYFVDEVCRQCDEEMET